MRDTYVKHGIAIINPYGGIWTSEIFETPDAAVAYLKSFWKEMPININEFRLAIATQTVTLNRSPGEPIFLPLPTC